MIDDAEQAVEGPRQQNFAERLLRGQEDFLTEILEGPAAEVRKRVLRMVALSTPCLVVYGATMGLPRLPWQPLLSAVKVPILLYGTLIACFPALFVFNVLVGSRVGLGRTFALAASAVSTTSLILGAFAPISLVFSLGAGADEYPFLLLFHVAAFFVSGVFGAVALHRNLCLVCERSDIYPRTGLRLLEAWILVFGFVGIQIAWNLRPFVGDPNQRMELLRSGGNVYLHLVRLPREAFGP